MTRDAVIRPDGDSPAESPSLADILTTASAVAHFMGGQGIRAEHVAKALAIQRGQLSMEDLGKPLSPLVQRYPRGAGPGVEPAVQVLVQRWFDEVGSVTVPLSEAQMETMARELAALAG